MRIGIDASPIFYQRGGVGIYTLNLIENLIQLNNGHRFFLYTTHFSSESFSFLHHPDIQIMHGMKPYLRYRIWKDKIEVLHGTNFRLPGTGFKGNVITIHDLALEKYPSYGKKRLGSGLSSWRTRRRALSADRIIAVSQNSLEDIVQLFGVSREKIRAIHSGIDAFFFPDYNRELLLKAKNKFGIRNDQFILFAGTIEPRKNIKTLLRAFSKSPFLRNKYSLVIAGGKGWKNEAITKAIQDEGIENQVSITGYIAKEELRVLYSFASCFVFPSLYEGFGFPPLEAMACGVPVICSNSSSLPEVAGDAALMVDPHDIDGFSAGMEKIVDNEDLRKKMIQRGFERIKHFTWKETARKTMEVYEEVYHSIR